jgi:hypothetical protein
VKILQTDKSALKDSKKYFSFKIKIKKLITLGYGTHDMSMVLTTNSHENPELEPSVRIIPLD